jgi:DNA-binding response OmpR family regulator
MYLPVSLIYGYMTNGNVHTQQTQKTILIVEDDPILSRMYTEKFTFEGFKVLVARDGEEALKVTEIEDVDTILLDIMLPRMSGTDFLERFRQVEKNKKIPVIALSNLTEQEERDRAMKLGVKEYLVKAMQTPEQVVVKIKKYLGETAN